MVAVNEEGKEVVLNINPEAEWKNLGPATTISPDDDRKSHRLHRKGPYDSLLGENSEGDDGP
jgi:hypothetical protein